MSDTPATPDGANAQAGGAQPSLRILVQYVKDLSFENPQAPHSFQLAGKEANMDVGVDISARSLAEGQFEVELRTTATAKNQDQDQSVFVAEVVYAGVFELQNVPPEQVEPLLLIECPRMLFPFMRRIIADAVRDGGYPPLMIDPIDFVALYQQRKITERAEGGQA